MNTPPIQIIADHREAKSSVLDTLRSMEEVAVKIETLPLGDYNVDNKLLFERKTLVDFVA
ncbi:hypothetical protein GWO43_18745 [candidate division KSB1 bacterium]|nr:hypothetical protein [candidate division KSB1 bacterium]NIS26074.1 hypothetical protein [candidate division KSB1 bacterium]NIT72874.1 hypothetical protein [candidate division KSB1 bacterium]NIU23238.1 hypothetical protein [candidate division KSB1 bacterium]NIU91974.1 hypothetical protein [candidate division KSB1 bacterium]